MTPNRLRDIPRNFRLIETDGERCVDIGSPTLAHLQRVAQAYSREGRPVPRYEEAR
jgi:hypothetical protein